MLFSGESLATLLLSVTWKLGSIHNELEVLVKISRQSIQVALWILFTASTKTQEEREKLKNDSNTK